MLSRDITNESLLTNEELWEILIEDAGIDYSAKGGNYKLYMHLVPNGKVYIGVTCHTIRRRWGVDGRRYKGQQFYKAIEEYGWDNIEHYVIAEHLNHDQANLLESVFISYYKSNNPIFGYNKTKGGDRHDNARTSNKVICIDTQEIYSSVYQAEKATGIPNAYIYLCCSGNSDYAGHSSEGKPLKWMFLDEYKAN